MSDDRCSDGDCDRPAKPKARKLCPKHYQRARRRGLIKRPTAEERLWAKVRKTETCWLWTGNRDSWGYGQISINRVKHLVHRFVYELLVGPIPDGLTLDHRCRVRLCCNPAHLEPATRTENTMRGESLNARNGRKTECVHGHPFDLINTYWRPDGTRQCRECRNSRARAARAKGTAPR